MHLACSGRIHELLSLAPQPHACSVLAGHIDLVQGAEGGCHEEVIVIVIVVLQASICSTTQGLGHNP